METPADTYMDKEEFMLKFHAARSEWDAMLAEVGTARMLEPGVTDEGWTVKDVVAHNTWNEREIVEMTRTHSMASLQKAPISPFVSLEVEYILLNFF